MYKPKDWTSKRAVVGGEVFQATITTGSRHYYILYFTTGASSKGGAGAAGENQLQRNRRSPRTTAAVEQYSTHGRRPRSPSPLTSAQVPQTLDSRRHTVTERARVSSVAHKHDTSSPSLAECVGSANIIKIIIILLNSISSIFGS